jgi:hypothetical protein
MQVSKYRETRAKAVSSQSPPGGGHLLSAILRQPNACTAADIRILQKMSMFFGIQASNWQNVSESRILGLVRHAQTWVGYDILEFGLLSWNASRRCVINIAVTNADNAA